MAGVFAGELFSRIEQGVIEPMIVVSVDGINRVGGSNYDNFSAIGRWEELVARDLVTFVGANFQTLPNRASRGIGGHSMGAGGAMSIALANPDVFSAVYAVKGYMDYPPEGTSIWDLAQWERLLGAV